MYAYCGCIYKSPRFVSPRWKETGRVSRQTYPHLIIVHFDETCRQYKYQVEAFAWSIPGILSTLGCKRKGNLEDLDDLA